MSEEFAQASSDASTNAYHQPVEKMLNQEQVNALVGREKAAAADKARREADERYRVELERHKNSNQPSFDVSSLLNEAKRAAKEEMINELNAHKQKTAEENYKAQQESHARQYVDHVKGIQVDPEEDPSELFSNPLQYKELALMAGELNLEDTADIMKELARKPGKLASAYTAALTGNKALLRSQFKQISQSIKQNKEALTNSPKVNAPLTQIKPSSTGSGVARSKMTLAELKKQSWLQG